MTPVTKRLIWLGAALALLAVLAIPKLTARDEGPGGNRMGGMRGGGGRNDTLSVSTFLVKSTELSNRVRTTGTLRANESVNLVSEASGKLVKIYFREGQSVAKGALLVKINDSDLQAQKQRARYRLALAQQRETRQLQVLKQGGISQEEYDTALNEVNVLRSEIEVIDAQIAKTEIRAPFAGIVGLRNVSEGTFISPQTNIATLSNVNPIKMDFAIPEKFTNEVRIGSEVIFRVEGSQQEYRGKIYAVEPGIEQNTRTLQLRAISSNPGGSLVPGAYANVEMVLENIRETIAIPANAVIPELDRKKVFVVEEGVAAPRFVETGMRTDSSVQILSGLKVGDRVVTSAILQIRPGSPLRISGSERATGAVQRPVADVRPEGSKK